VGIKPGFLGLENPGCDFCCWCCGDAMQVFIVLTGCKYRVVGATSQMPYTEKAKHFLGYVLQPIAICVCLW